MFFYCAWILYLLGAFNLIEIEYKIKFESSDKNLLEDNVDATAKIIYEFIYSTSTTNITNNLSLIRSSSCWQTKQASSSSYLSQ